MVLVYTWVREELSDRVVLDGEAYNSGTVQTSDSYGCCCGGCMCPLLEEGIEESVGCGDLNRAIQRCGLHKG